MAEFADLTWAQTVPRFGTTQPIYPTFNPPQFDPAKAYEAANSVMAGKLTNQLRANEVSQTPVANALQAARLEEAQRANREGAATESSDVNAQIAKDDTVEYEKMQKQDATTNQMAASHAVAIDAATTAIDDNPDDPGEIERQKQALKQKGVPDDVAESWAAHVGGADGAANRLKIHDQSQKTESAYQRYREISSTGTGTESALTRRGTEVEIAAIRAGSAAVAALDSSATPEQKQAAYDEAHDRVANSAFGGGAKPFPATGSPAAGAKPTVQPPAAIPDFLKADTYGRGFGVGLPSSGTPALGAPEAAAAGSVAADKTAREAQVTGKARGFTSNDEDTGKKGKSEKEANGDGTPQNPYRYAGDPLDENAQVKWVEGLQKGEWFINPATGKPLVKKATGGDQ